MMDIMPMSAQRTSLSKFSSPKPLIVVEKTQISIDPTLLSHPTLRTRPDPNPIRVLNPNPFRSSAKSVPPKPILEPRRMRSLRDFRCPIPGRKLMCLIKGSLGVDDLGKKFRVLEKGLERFDFDGAISSSRMKN